MTNVYVVRIGSCGTVGRYVADDQQADDQQADDQQTYDRGTRVVCRTQRGLEVGEVLARDASRVLGEELDGDVDGDLVRPLDEQDEALLKDQARRRAEAIAMCQTLLDQACTPAVVVDAVYPLDEQHICFYVLGELEQSMSSVAREIGTQFNVNVLFRPAAEGATSGCGSGGCDSGGCGSDGGCSTGGCGTCPATDACGE